MATPNRIRALNRLPFDFEDGLRVGGTDIIAAQNKLLGRQVKSLNELSNINVSALSDRDQVTVSEYHAQTGIGGGIFYWDSSRPKSDHNGGTVIDPAREFPSSLQNSLSLTAWYSYNATVGVGAFVRLQQNDEFHVNDFGALPNSLSNGTLNWYATKTCVSSAIDYRYKRNKGFNNDFVDLRTNGKVVFGKGYYVFDHSNPLRPEISTDVPIWHNSKRRGLSFVGAGLDQTVLYNSGASGQDFYFWENLNTSADGSGRLAHGYDLVQFNGLSFHGPFSDNSARNYGVSHPRASGSKVNAFGIYSTGWDKYFSFHEVGFSGIDIVMDISGTSNGDSMSFFRCVFAPIRQSVFRCSNDQSVGNSFTECIYTLFGDFLTIGGGGGGGTQVRGGSFVVYPQFEDDGTASVSQTENALVNAFFTDTPSSRGSYYTFTGVSFEFYHPNQKDIIVNSNVVEGSYRVLFDDCDWNTTMNWVASNITVPATEAPATVINGRGFGCITYRKCFLHWSRTIKVSNNAASNSYIAVPSIELLNNTCNWAVLESSGKDGLLTNKINVVSGGANVHVTGTIYPLINSNQDQGRSYSSEYKGVVGIGNVSPEGKVVISSIKVPGHPWGSGTNTNKLLLPVQAKVVRIKIYRAATASPNNYTMTLTNGLLDANKITYMSWTQPENQLLDVDHALLITNHNGLIGLECSATNLEGLNGFSMVEYI